jgi:hypothetical protein
VVKHSIPKVKKTTLPNTPGRQAAQARYNAKPEQKKRRAERNKTRRLLEKQGRVHKGDGKDIDHKDHNTNDLSPSNLQVQPKRVNRKDGGPSAKMRTK